MRRSMLFAMVAAWGLVGCTGSSAPAGDGGGGQGGGQGDASGDGAADGAADAAAPDLGPDAPEPFVLTSTAFVEGAMIPAAHTCAGANGSPPLAWTAGPAGTLSYAVLFTDKSNNLIHWAIWDIPADVRSLPASVATQANPPVPMGAKQVRSYDNVTYGYLGPCPSGMLHNYEFVVYALDVSTLPAVTIASTRSQVSAQVLMHDVALASLSGKSDARP